MGSPIHTWSLNMLSTLETPEKPLTLRFLPETYLDLAFEVSE